MKKRHDQVEQNVCHSLLSSTSHSLSLLGSTADVYQTQWWYQPLQKLLPPLALLSPLLSWQLLPITWKLPYLSLTCAWWSEAWELSTERCSGISSIAEFQYKSSSTSPTISSTSF